LGTLLEWVSTTNGTNEFSPFSQRSPVYEGCQKHIGDAAATKTIAAKTIHGKKRIRVKGERDEG
jgi:hypothetical protein